MGADQPSAVLPTTASASFGPSERRLSQILWGLDWARLLPRQLTQDGIFVACSSLERATPFIARHYAEIFEEGPESSPFVTKLSEAKARYYRTVGDFFEFGHEGRTVALLIGTPVDWSTYYIRSAAALPEYQGRKVVQRFLPLLFEELRSVGVERVEADTSPSNMATLHLLTRLRFNVTGTVLTERWGAHIHFTKFLDEQSEGVFLRQFCSGVKYQLRGHGSDTTRNS